MVTFAWFGKFIGYFRERGDWILGMYKRPHIFLKPIFIDSSSYSLPSVSQVIDIVIDIEFYSSK